MNETQQRSVYFNYFNKADLRSTLIAYEYEHTMGKKRRKYLTMTDRVKEDHGVKAIFELNFGHEVLAS